MSVIVVSKLKKTNLVAHANSLIEAQYSITKNEQILLFAMISLINPDDKEFLTFTVDYKILSEILGIDTKSALRELEIVITRLMGRVIKINTDKGWELYQWVSKAKLDNNIITLRFHDDLKPYLLELKKSGNFTQSRLGIAISFKSLYTIRIYQILKEYGSKKYKYFEFSLEEFRNMILDGNTKIYPLYKNFRNKVLDVAKKELEIQDKETGFYKSDLSFDLETKRTGRKISHLKFIIKKQKTKPENQLKIDLPEAQNPHQDTPEYQALITLAISENQASEFLDQYGVEYVAEKLQVLAERQQLETIKSPSGFLIKALKEDFKSEKLIQQQEAEKQKAKEAEKQRQEQLEKQKSELAYEFGKNARQTFLSSLDSTDEESLLEELKTQYKGDTFTLGEINRKGLTSMIIAGEIIKRIPDFEAKKEAYIKENLDY